MLSWAVQELGDNPSNRDVREVSVDMAFLVEFRSWEINMGGYGEWAKTNPLDIHNQVLKSVRKGILQGCKIVFSRVFPTSVPAESHQLWKMAEQLGATCSVELDSSVTHVVATDPKTEKSRWATEEEKYLVHPQWIEAAYYLWRRHPEDKYSVSQSKSR